jgi:hypothetical protein
MGKGRTVGERLGERPGFRQQRARLAQLVVEAPTLGFGAVHAAAGIQQLGRPARADNARQDIARPHIGTRQADAHEQERDLARGRAVTQVGCHGDDRAGAGAYPVDRRDDRLRAAAHGLDQIAGHAAEREQPAHLARLLHLDQRPDDFVHIPARAEVAAGAGHHDGLHFLRVGEIAEGVAKLGVRFEGQRVLALGAIEGDGRHLAVELPAEMPGLKGAEIHVRRAEQIQRFHDVRPPQPAMVNPPLTLITCPVM